MINIADDATKVSDIVEVKDSITSAKVKNCTPDELERLKDYRHSSKILQSCAQFSLNYSKTYNNHRCVLFERNINANKTKIPIQKISKHLSK